MNLSRTPRLKMLAADLALLLVAVIWGGGFIASKEALSSLSAFGVMSSRFLLSAAVMFLLFHKQILRGTGREIRYGVIIGAIQFIAFIFQLNGLALTTVERHSFLVTSYAIFVPFLSVALAHNPLRRRDVAAPCWRNRPGPAVPEAGKSDAYLGRRPVPHGGHLLFHSNRICRQLRQGG